MNASRRPVAGCLYGLALGDALAAPTEFFSVEAIVVRYGANGPAAPIGDPARVTDDTQMALAVGRALHRVVQPGPTAGTASVDTEAADTGAHPVPAGASLAARVSVGAVEEALRREFVAWSTSPDNDRAPGNTCLQACERLAAGVPWQAATVAGSKGCGANMRVAPVGLVPGGTGLDPASPAGLAQFQAALTHGHPTALAASDLTARAVTELVSQCAPAELPGRLRRYATDQRSVWHAEWLDGLWRRPGVDGPGPFIARGWDECLAVLDCLDAALLTADRATDPCLATGAGWVAEEALATGLLCFLLFPDDPVAALRRAAVTSGDSDSIACLTGAFAGAAHGIEAWPDDWRQRIEYRADIDTLASAWENT